MSVNENNRKFHRFQVTTKTSDLYAYTSKILGNEKHFPPEVDKDLVHTIQRTSRRIHIDAFKANEIRVDSIGKKKKRLELQRRAIDSCNELLALIEMTRPVFHTSNKRRVYWAKKTIETRSYLEKWNESDAKRYRKL